MSERTYCPSRVPTRPQCRSGAEHAATDRLHTPEPTTGRRPGTWWHRPKKIALMVYSAFTNRKRVGTGNESSPAPHTARAHHVAADAGPARWWRAQSRAPHPAEMPPTTAHVGTVAPVRTERERRARRSSDGQHTALWQHALFLAPDVAGAGTHLALRNQIDGKGRY
ncbi:hypothetical protein AB4305_26690 [Nocardia sp. 2YAB30]|uniref:hypothetical protein n=1 Tax=unclassified Nocardia TaxID=2637762 RepID=UPI003F9B1A0C